ncbi:MAG: hypothetical protein C5B57_08705 [Blastocatellia bacterium]|nr:MAG: hypothetical protein C5B57_08705 [Blastocatellia bacterium]
MTGITTSDDQKPFHPIGADEKDRPTDRDELSYPVFTATSRSKPRMTERDGREEQRQAPRGLHRAPRSTDRGRAYSFLRGVNYQAYAQSIANT